MIKKLQVVIVLFFMVSYASAGTDSIGTANARGDMRVDSYMVKGNATLFNGSVVETGQATANLQMNKGAEIIMATSSRGTLYGDHLVLQQGKSDFKASHTFRLEANGLSVVPNEPNSRGLVSLREGNTVEVAALTGGFGVTNDHGVLLAIVHPGRSLSFAMKQGADVDSFAGVGLVSKENGAYYLTTDENVKYVLLGKDLSKFVGDKVEVFGVVQAVPNGAGGAISTVTVSSININGEKSKKKLLVAGILVGSAAALGVGIYEATHASPAASITP